MCTLFYFTFYRMLFEEFVGWGVFAIVQLVHLTAEWCLYCIRATTTFYNFVKGLPDYLDPIKALAVMPGFSHRDWQIFLALDFGVRVAVMVFTAPVRVLSVRPLSCTPDGCCCRPLY